MTPWIGLRGPHVAAWRLAAPTSLLAAIQLHNATMLERIRATPRAPATTTQAVSAAAERGEPRDRGADPTCRVVDVVA